MVHAQPHSPLYQTENASKIANSFPGNHQRTLFWRFGALFQNPVDHSFRIARQVGYRIKVVRIKNHAARNEFLKRQLTPTPLARNDISC